MWVAFQITLPIGCTTPWCNPVQILGGLKAFQVVDFALIAVMLAVMLGVAGFIAEGLVKNVRSVRLPCPDESVKKPHRASPIDICVKHRFLCANAVHRLRSPVKDAICECLHSTLVENVRHAIKWSGEDLSTVTVEVSLGNSKKPENLNAIALGLSECLARIDAKDQEAERAQADLV